MTVWRLKKGADFRIRSGHPWIFSNELQQSPKGHPPGAPVQLMDASGKFVAVGYGNPTSLISFRSLSYYSDVENPFEINFIVEKLFSALRARINLGMKRSFRMVFSESDFFPGLIIDRYLVEHDRKRYQVLAMQLLTAGAQVAMNDALPVLQKLVEKALQEKLIDINWDKTAVVLRNDVNIRKLEGLQVEEPKILKEVHNLNLEDTLIVLDACSTKENEILMHVNLKEGQKTGFFLDQSWNIQVVSHLLKRKKYKILDLCCYNGQWSTKLAEYIKHLGGEAEVDLVDVSDMALNFAKKNVERVGATAKIHKLDVLEGLGNLSDKTYDIVIADPPAFIKARKDIPTGSAAYLKLNTHAFRLARKDALVVSCSCSGLMEEDNFKQVLSKAIRRSGFEARCVAKGGHAVDHPTLTSFPEGFYLKMLCHFVQVDEKQ